MAEELTVVCAWCKRHLKGPWPPKDPRRVSHALCDPCRATHFPDLPRAKNPGWRLRSIKKSPKKGKKLVAVFEDRDTGRTKTTHFGATGYSDFTKHKDPERKARYVARHEGKEDWSDPTTPGALSRWVLWDKPSLKASVASFKRRFRLNPSPARDEMFRQTAEAAFEKMAEWFRDRSEAQIVRAEKRNNLSYPIAGSFSFWFTEFDKKGPKDLIVVLAPAKHGEAGSAGATYDGSGGSTDGDRLRIIVLYALSRGLSRVSRDLSDEDTRQFFVHEFTHLLDHERWGEKRAWGRKPTRKTGGEQSYYRSPHEMNAYFQQGWSALEVNMREASAREIEERLERGWENFLRVNLSAFWSQGFLRAIRRSKPLLRKFLARTRLNWEHSVPAWQALAAEKRRRDPRGAFDNAGFDPWS